MLFLDRHVDECVIINGDIVVKVIKLKHDKVRLGFSAPPGVTIDRTEVAMRKRQKELESKENG